MSIKKVSITKFTGTWPGVLVSAINELINAIDEGLLELINSEKKTRHHCMPNQTIQT